MHVISPVVVSLGRPLERVLREAAVVSGRDADPAPKLRYGGQLHHGHCLLKDADRLLPNLLLL
jgi:hypothetical protein